MSFQPSRLDRLAERLVVLLVLIGVTLGEVADRVVEGVTLAEVLGDGYRITGAACARARVQPQMRA